MILFLIGFRGTGKTTLGRLLADRLDWRWVDSDVEIEKFSQRTISGIFERDGETGFREIEQKVIGLLVARIAPREPAVISLGGGAVLSGQTRELIRQHGQCVWLNAPANCLVERIAANQSLTPRPALTEMDLAEEVSRLIQDREPVYSDCADYTINTNELSVEQAVEQIAQWLAEVDKE